MKIVIFNASGKSTIFTFVIKNDIPYIRDIWNNQISDHRIYKITSKKPYIRYMGEVMYLEPDMKEELRKYFKGE